MRYLVTGGSGFLGRYIVDYLENNGDEVFIATREVKQPNHIYTDFEKGVLEINPSPALLFDYVIHAAGKAHMVPKTEAEKQAFYQVNVEGTKLLLDNLDALVNKPKGFVFISTVAVYGVEIGIDIKENQALAAINPYGQSKIEAEKLIQEWGKKNNVIIGIARLPLVAGKNAPGNLNSMIKGIKNGRYFRIGKGNAKKSMVWAGDIAAILPILAQKGGIYNFTDGYHPSFAELEDGITSAMRTKPVKEMPGFMAKLAGTFGTIAEKITGKKMPINTDILQKITATLTFSDEKARNEISWKPSKVLDHIKEMI